MSKKYRRRIAKKRRKKHQKRQNRNDTHHICYQRRYWCKGGLKELREFWYSRILIPRDTLHRELHHEVWAVHPPREVNARSALAQLNMLEKYGSISHKDSLEKRLMLFIALFDGVEQKTADDFRKQLDVVRSFYYGSP